MIKLSKRLAVIAACVPYGSRLADIGSDHALLPVYLVQQGIISQAVAGELNAGPYEAAKLQVNKAGLQHLISVRRGDGLRVLRSGEVDTVTIAGMGGSLIVDILNRDDASILADVRTLILQPNVAADAVRRWLSVHDYVLRDEQMVTEDGVTYEILSAEQARYAEITHEEVYRTRQLPSGYVATYEELIRFGPYQLERFEPSFVRKWQAEKEKLEKIRQQIAMQSASPEAAQRIREIDEEIATIMKVLQGS